MRSAHSGFNNVSYLVMLQALSKLDDLNGLATLYREWQSGYIFHDTRLPISVIDAYLRHDRYEEAALVFEETARTSKGPFFNVRERFIYYFIKNRRIDFALVYLQANVSEAKTNKWASFKPQLVAAFFNYFLEEKDVDKAERVFKILRPIHRPNFEEYGLLLKVYAAAGEFSTEMRSRLDEDGIVVTAELEDLLQRVCPK